MNAFARALPRPATAGEVSKCIPGAVLTGDPGRIVRGIGALSSRAPDLLAFCDAIEASERLTSTGAAVIIVPSNAVAAPNDGRTLIAADDVRAAFIDVVATWLPGSERPNDPPPGVDAAARIHPDASVVPGACIGANVEVGARSRIAPGAVVYADTVIGRDCVVGPGAVIGWVGLAYHDRADGRRSFFPHLAGVRIGDGVDIGAQACICRGMLSHTEIGSDVKIGSLVYVSHGVVVGARSWLSAGTAVAGHARLADAALLGIGSVVVDNVELETGVLVGGGSVVVRNARAGDKLVGVPAHAVPSMRRFGPTPRD